MWDRIRGHAVALCVTAVCLAAGIAYVVGSVESVSARVSSLNHALLVSEKASTKTRVTTVAQRCSLTQQVRALDLVLASHADARHGPADAEPFYLAAAAFQTSYLGCEKQLAQVEAINAKTPTP